MSDDPAPSVAMSGSARYAKTDVGRAECQRHTHTLSRPARNLLLIIDASRSGMAWLGMVQAAFPSDLQTLLDAGLVAVQPGAAGAPAATVPQRTTLAQALQTKGYRTLVDRITAEARPRLGLIKGYKMILDVERCQGAPEVRALAQRFVEQVRVADGDSVALTLAQVLLAPD